MAARLCVHPAFYRRVRHYRDRIGVHDGRPEVAVKFARAAAELVLQLLQNPQRGHSAGFESVDLAEILPVTVPGFPVFAVFYRWDGQTSPSSLWNTPRRTCRLAWLPFFQHPSRKWVVNGTGAWPDGNGAVAGSGLAISASDGRTVEP